LKSWKKKSLRVRRNQHRLEVSETWANRFS